MLKPEKPDPATTLKGLEYVDIPGLSKKDYKLNFYAHKEGSFSAKVSSIILYTLSPCTVVLIFAVCVISFQKLRE